MAVVINGLTGIEAPSVTLDTDTLVIDATNNRVGIGTTSPAYSLDIDGNARLNPTSNPVLRFSENGTLRSLITGSSSIGLGIETQGALPFRVVTNASERMRIDSDGRLLLGKTTNDNNLTGVRLATNGSIATADQLPVLYLNRTTNDGTILEFRKDNINIGTIGVDFGNNVFITGQAAGHCGLQFAGANVAPMIQDSLTDNQVNLGDASTRFKDLYLSGGVYLGGTGSANKLEDYEEGTWTPTVHSGLSSITYTQQLGDYIVIGSYCFFSIRLRIASSTASADRIDITLPFTGSGNFSPTGTATFAYVDSTIVNSTTTNLPTLWKNDSTNRIEFYNTAGGNFTGTNLGSTVPNFYISGHYQIA